MDNKEVRVTIVPKWILYGILVTATFLFTYLTWLLASAISVWTIIPSLVLTFTILSTGFFRPKMMFKYYLTSPLLGRNYLAIEPRTKWRIPMIKMVVLPINTITTHMAISTEREVTINITLRWKITDDKLFLNECGSERPAEFIKYRVAANLENTAKYFKESALIGNNVQVNSAIKRKVEYEAILWGVSIESIGVMCTRIFRENIKDLTL